MLRIGLHKLVLSDRLVGLLRNINDPIAKKLLFFNNNSDFGFPISYIDITDNENFVTFTSSDKINDNSIGNVLGGSDTYDWNKNRNRLKIGKMINRILPNTPRNIEIFVNKYKSEYNDLFDVDSDFQIVDGENIRKYYYYKYYSSGGGSLNKSCMRHDNCQPYFDFYVMNDDIVKMLILKDKDGETIIGRALIWDLKDYGITLMDRVYTTLDTYQFTFIKYAIKNGWWYKNTMTPDEKFFKLPNGKKEYKDFKVKLKDVEYTYFPYLDTFKYYNIKEKYITNSDEEYKNNKYIVILRRTNGEYRDNGNFAFDDFIGDYVNVNDIVYTISDESVHKKYAIKLNNRYYIDDSYVSPSDIVYSKYDNNIYHRKDMVWSKHLNTFICKNNSYIVYLDKSDDNYDYLPSSMYHKDFEFCSISRKHYIMDLMVKGFDGNFYREDLYDIEKIKKLKSKKRKDNTVSKMNTEFDNFLMSYINKVYSYTITTDYVTTSASSMDNIDGTISYTDSGTVASSSINYNSNGDEYH
jgi:hypothetical protein